MELVNSTTQQFSFPKRCCSTFSTSPLHSTKIYGVHFSVACSLQEQEFTYTLISHNLPNKSVR